ncbi:MAG: hypothetical protein AB1768_18215 [Pseudomonadota bacterium]|jgi:hypothetical protein
MIDSQPSPHDGDNWPRAATRLTALAVAATIGAAMVVYVLTSAGGAVGTRLLVVLPIYFVAAFALGFMVFWGVFSAVAWYKERFADGVVGSREHAAAVLLTFVAVSLLQLSQGAALQSIEATRPAAVEGGVPAAQLRAAPPDERLVAAQGAALRPDAYAVLMRDPDLRVRLALAQRPDLPAELMEFLADDRAPQVRAVVAASPKTDDATLRRLAYDREEDVRLAVAGNATAAPGVLEILATSTAAVRAAVAANPRTGREVLLLLAGDEDAAVATAALRHLAGEGRRP